MKTITKRITLLMIAVTMLNCSKDDPETIIETTEPVQIVTVSTIAGNGEEGSSNGIGSEAQFNRPLGMAIDDQGNIFVADSYNHLIRKITTDGTVTTYAGSKKGDEDGTLLNAKFSFPAGVAVGNFGNVYVADTGNNKIKKITPFGAVITIAGKKENGYEDGQASMAQFDYPSDVDLDSNGNIFVADYYNNKIRKITPEGIVSTIAGSDEGFADGLAMNAQFKYPTNVSVDTSGNLFVADNENNRIRKVSSDGVVSTVAGSTSGYADGNNSNAKFNYPEHIALDSAGNLYITDTYNNRIRKISADGKVTTFAGSTEGYTDGIGAVAQFKHPVGIAISTDGTIYTTDEKNHSIRKISIEQ